LSHLTGIIELMFDSLHKAIDELATADPDRLSDAELHDLLLELQRQSTRLAAVCTRTVGASDARKVWASNGSKSPAARLARETRCALSTAHATVRRSRQLRSMPTPLRPLRQVSYRSIRSTCCVAPTSPGSPTSSPRASNT
jgi:hypothetical protein